jgi:processive 1,2-diacylglycerol beta-glucosyltransferase
VSTRILFLTAGFGEGHNAAARALTAACNELHGAGSARMIDVFELARPRMNRLSRQGYLSLINRAPWTWSAVYRWLDRSSRAAWLFAPLVAERRVLARLIATEKPEALCSTYPLYAFMLRTIAKRTALPAHHNVVTDSISINSLWWRAGASSWFVPNRDSAEVLLDAGLPAPRVRTLGFPVSPFFADEQGRLAPPALGGEVRPRILYIINSVTRGATETALNLLAHEEWDVTCTVGRDEPMRRVLTAAAARRRRPATVLGWTNEIPRLLMTHHVVVSKAGGATTQEAIAARCPMLVNQIVPGQEEGNYDLLRRHGIGGLATTPDGVVDVLRFAFQRDAAQWRAWRAAVDRLARPNAAREIVAAMLPLPPSSARRPIVNSATA